jgi:hypothetical protein
VPLHERVDNDWTTATADSQATAFLWTLANVAEDLTREAVLAAVVAAYAASSLTVSKAAVFRECHPSSKSELEKKWHFHVVVETTSRARWRAVAAELRGRGFPANCSTLGMGRSTYWTGFAYCYVPSAKKPLSDLDTEHLTSAGHPDLPRRLQVSRKPPRRLKPGDLAKTVYEQGIRSMEQMHVYANEQLQAGC